MIVTDLHTLEALKFIERRPVEDECCNVSIYDLWAHDIDDKVQRVSNLLIFLHMRYLITLGMSSNDSACVAAVLLHKKLTCVTQENTSRGVLRGQGPSLGLRSVKRTEKAYNQPFAACDIAISYD